MSSTREITGISALDEETSRLQQQRGGGGGGGGRGRGGGARSRSQNSSWNEGPAERARRDLEDSGGGYDDDGVDDPYDDRGGSYDDEGGMVVDEDIPA